MCRISFFLYCFLLCFNVSAQSDSIYQSLIAKASLFHLQKNYEEAIILYEKALEIQQPDALTAYNAAGMYSLDNNADKAFEYLQLAISYGWTQADWLSFDPYFDYLRKTFPAKWEAINKQAKINEYEYAKSIRFPDLRKELNLMMLNDQKLRYKRVQSNNDSLLGTIEQQINKSDLDNLNRAKDIIKQYGWPKMSDIGKDGQNSLWLIVQHADQDVHFQQTALAAMEQLLGTNEIDMENYAFLYDRVKCNLNYKQLYGTQVVWTTNGEASEFRPVEKEYGVDERREKLEMQPLRVYALRYGFEYQKISVNQSAINDSIYQAHVQQLIDSAKYFYTKKEFLKTFDYYNTASTFLGGMSNTDNLEAAIIFSKIAVLNYNDRYKSIALDFLNLLYLRSQLTKTQLLNQKKFNILHKEQRWIELIKQLDK